MPTIYLRKDLYDVLVKTRKDPSQYVNEKVAELLNPPVTPEPVTKISRRKEVKENDGRV